MIANGDAGDKVLMVHAMMLACHIDGAMNPEELAHVEAYAKSLPEFKGQDFHAYYREAKGIAVEAGNVETAVARIGEIRSERLRLKTYLCIAELVFANGDVTATEEHLLEASRVALGVDPDLATRIRDVQSIKFQ